MRLHKGRFLPLKQQMEYSGQIKSVIAKVAAFRNLIFCLVPKTNIYVVIAMFFFFFSASFICIQGEKRKTSTLRNIMRHHYLLYCHTLKLSCLYYKICFLCKQKPSNAADVLTLFTRYLDHTV